jgi:hypothetical protein
VQIVADAIEKPPTAAEERRHDVDLHLVHEAGREILLCGTRSAGELDILVAGGSPRLVERAASMPSVTNVNVVPPSSSSGSRA